MKRMLLTLFLLFCLHLPNGMNSAGEVGVSKDNTAILKIIKHNSLVDSILLQIGERDTIAYLSRRDIPIYSPIKPVTIQMISSDYGWRKHPVLLNVLRHHGIDIAAPLGTSVMSTANGMVVKAEKSKRGYGNEIIIKHEHNYETRYAHLDSVIVKVGQQVEQGTIIGTVGVTGMTTGPHLHYEILKNKIDIDPLFFTYKEKKDRTITKYISTLIELELT